MNLSRLPLVILAGVLVAGCSMMGRRSVSSTPDKPLRMVRKNEKVKPGEHGLQIIKIVDEQGRERTVYIYVPRGVPRSLIEAIDERNVAKVLEMAGKEREKNTRAALFGARWDQEHVLQVCARWLYFGGRDL